MPSKYQCCFCGLGIEPAVPDTGSLLYTTCIDGPSQKQHDQEIFCHSQCLASRLHPSVQLYAAFLTGQETLEEAKSTIAPGER